MAVDVFLSAEDLKKSFFTLLTETLVDKADPRENGKVLKVYLFNLLYSMSSAERKDIIAFLNTLFVASHDEVNVEIIS